MDFRLLSQEGIRAVRDSAPASLMPTAVMFIPFEESVPDQTNFTLLMPAVSVGNVGQLATDLIISTLNMSKIGYFYTDCLVPMVGNNPYATEEENSV